MTNILESDRMGYLPMLTSHDLAAYLITQDNWRVKLSEKYREGYTFKKMIEIHNLKSGNGKFVPMNLEDAILGLEYFFHGFEGDNEFESYQGLINDKHRR